MDLVASTEYTSKMNQPRSRSWLQSDRQVDGREEVGDAHARVHGEVDVLRPARGRGVQPPEPWEQRRSRAAVEGGRVAPRQGPSLRPIWPTRCRELAWPALPPCNGTGWVLGTIWRVRAAAGVAGRGGGGGIDLARNPSTHVARTSRFGMSCRWSKTFQLGTARFGGICT
jgi:hypothetical protein